MSHEVLQAIAEGTGALSPMDLQFILSGLPYSQAELARLLGRDRSTLSKYKSGENPIDPLVASALREIVREFLAGQTRTSSALADDKSATRRAFDDRVTIEPSTEDFEYWLTRSFVKEDLRNCLGASNFLLVPAEGFREEHVPVFPLGTEEFLQHLKELAPPDVVVDICITDEEYRELALHGLKKILATVVVQQAMLPFAIGLLANYVSSKTFGSDHTVKVEIVAVGGAKDSLRITYEGSAVDFQSTVLKAVESFKVQLSQTSDHHAHPKTQHHKNPSKHHPSPQPQAHQQCDEKGKKK